jgi:hypothetical protein
MDITTFSSELEDAVLDEARHPTDGSDGGRGEDFRENAFTRIVVRDLSDAGALAAPVACHYAGKYKGHDFKVSAYEIIEEDLRLCLVVTDYKPVVDGQMRRLNADDIDRAFRQAERFLAFVLDPHTEGPDPSQPSHSMIVDISSRREEFKDVQISLITNGLLAIKKEKQRKSQLLGYAVGHEVWDLERLRRFRSAGSSHEPIEVDLSAYPGGGLACLSNADPLAGYSTSVAVIPGAVLADWYDEYGSRLLELNVRSYLQAKGKINRGILETLIKEPDRFLAYNNGITIVAEHIEFTPDQGRVKTLRGVQIVNGGQTTASIHRARREHKADLSRVYVQAKITKVPEDQFETVVPEISRLSNTQNKVSEVDLRARDNFHVGLERVALRKWVPGQGSKWFYERARGSYQTERARQGRTKAQRDRFDQDFPAEQRITKEDIARYVNAYDGFPHLVSLGGQKNFLRFMEGIPKHEKDWEPSDDEYQELIGRAILYRGVQDLVKEVSSTSFRVNLVNYLVALIGYKTGQRVDFKKIWDQQGLSPALQAQVKEWIPGLEDVLTQSAAGKNPTEWFKKDQCWQLVKEKAETLAISRGLAKELRDNEGANVLPDEASTIEVCKERNAREWFQVYQWGEQSNELTRAQLDVARRMAELASEDWRRSPTAKQAVEARKVLDAYNSRA